MKRRGLHGHGRRDEEPRPGRHLGYGDRAPGRGTGGAGLGGPAFVPDWRWLLDREDSPWYPTMRLFRQTKPGNWEDVFERMAEELRRAAGRPLSRGRSRSRSRQES